MRRISLGRTAVPVLWGAFVAAAFVARAEDAAEQLKATLRKDVGEGCEIRDTDHWLIAYKADPKWVDAAAKMLERTHELFFEQFKKAGFEPHPPKQKLVCVLLGEQEAFAKYLERVRDTAGPSAPDEPRPQAKPKDSKRPAGLGSYSGRTNRIQMCDMRSIAENTGRSMGPAKVDQENIVRVAHEATHQLSFNCGILNPRGCPMWLAEGLATNFEFSDAEKPFGPLTDNLSPRAARLKQLDADGKILSLKQIVTMSPAEAHQPANKGPTYAAGWGLVRLLFTERPKQFKQYLAAMAERRTNAPQRGARRLRGRVRTR